MTLSLHLYSIAEDFRPSLRPILRSGALLLPTLWTQPIHRARALVEVVHQVTSGHQEGLGCVLFFLTWVGFCQWLGPWQRLEGRYEEEEEEKSQVPFRHPASIQLGLAVLVGPKIPYVDELDHEKEFLRTGPHDSEGKGRGSMQS